MSSDAVVIVGAGHAGTQLALSLRQLKYAGPVVLVSDECELPYQRPPLSKAFMLRKVELPGMLLRNASIYEQQDITWRCDTRIRAIDRAKRSLELANGERLDYGTLVLATGTRNRQLALAGAQLDGVVYLRTYTEAHALRERLGTSKNVVVLGGGFIGLEFAAVARSQGLNVTVVEASPRLMSRALSPPMSDWFRALHEGQGVDVRCGTTIERIDGEGGRVTSVLLSSGESLPADLVVVGIGVLPNSELARAAGLTEDNGIRVDARLATDDPHIFAIGDCASFACRHLSPHLGTHARLESVQNAVDHAKHVAAVITGTSGEYRQVPWFWSDQFEKKLQIAGLTTGADQWSLVGDPETGAFGVHCFAQGRWLGFESVNQAGEHLAARKAIETDRRPTFDDTRVPGFELRSWLPRQA